MARLQPGEIAVIDHEDLDEVAARSLVEAKPALWSTPGGRSAGAIPTPGPRIVLEAGIPVLDAVGDGVFKCLADGDVVEVKGGRIYRDGRLIAEGRQLTREGVEEAYAPPGGTWPPKSKPLSKTRWNTPAGRRTSS